MKNKLLSKIFEDYNSGKITKDYAMQKILNLNFISKEPIANIDFDREDRSGFPEVVYGLNKTNEQIAIIAEKIFNHSKLVLVTRANVDAFNLVKIKIPSAKFSHLSKCIWADSRKNTKLLDGISIISAGTSDLSISEEAKITANLMGYSTNMITDVGVAGLHRLTSRLSEIRKSKILIVIAGMEGALPSVVSGLVKNPIIAVPTSIGYGANFGGISALLSMINSCAPGISVVNIDNGFGAAYQAAMIMRTFGK
tara:strand:+ start:21373 stop:22131 length:759 start_codon:yes stop_codon:yes gene_type:complete